MVFDFLPLHQHSDANVQMLRLLMNKHVSKVSVDKKNCSPSDRLSMLSNNVKFIEKKDKYIK